jgi:hypothetical protein
MTIRESTTLVLGYGLGDMNVLSAVDWSKNIYTEKNEYPYEIIQALWTTTPQEEAYKDENGNIIIEINDLEYFLNELIVYIVEKQKTYDLKIKELKALVEILESNNEEWIQKFIDERDFRLKLLDLLSDFEYHMISSYIQFLTVCINRIWEMTSVNGAFQVYDKYLCIILDIVIKYEYKKMPPRLFQLVAESLNKVLSYVGSSTTRLSYGDSWSATRTWHASKNEIPIEMKYQLYLYSKQNRLNSLLRNIREILEE